MIKWLLTIFQVDLLDLLVWDWILFLLRETLKVIQINLPLKFRWVRHVFVCPIKLNTPSCHLRRWISGEVPRSGFDSLGTWVWSNEHFLEEWNRITTLKLEEDGWISNCFAIRWSTQFYTCRLLQESGINHSVIAGSLILSVGFLMWSSQIPNVCLLCSVRVRKEIGFFKASLIFEGLSSSFEPYLSEIPLRAFVFLRTIRFWDFGPASCSFPPGDQGAGPDEGLRT